MFLINEDYAQQNKAGTQIIESTTSANGNKQVTIKTILQTCGDVNKNNRIYPRDLMSNAIKDVIPMVEANTLTGELDHPVPTGVSETDSYRHFVVLYDRVSHIIKDVYLEGNNIMGIVQTASTQKGHDLAGLISDGVPVGFSLRAMGESETMPNGTTMIKAPLSIITWDCVSNPSHAKARMQSIVKENFNGATSKTEAKALVESAFGGNNIALNRSSILTNAFIKQPKYKTAEERYNKIMENIDILTDGGRDKAALRYMSKLFEDYLGEPFDLTAPFDEGYLNPESKVPVEQVHNKILDYLDEYLDVNRSNSDTRDYALFSKHFLKGTNYLK